MYINVNILMSEAQHIRFKIYVSEFDSHISGKSDTIKLDVLLKIIRVRKIKYFFRNSSKKYSNLSSYDKKISLVFVILIPSVLILRGQSHQSSFVIVAMTRMRPLKFS